MSRDPVPPHDVVGLDALSPLLEDVDFPATKHEILASVGDVQIPVSRDRSRPLSAILDALPPERFASNREVEEAVARMWDDLAGRTGRGGRHPERGNVGDRPIRHEHARRPESKGPKFKEF